MDDKHSNNLTSVLERAAHQIAGAENETQKAEAVRRLTSEVQQLTNSEKLAAGARLARWLAHQINNPLATMSGNAQLLARRLESDASVQESLPRYMACVEAIHIEAERCAAITGELLDFTRPKDLRPETIDVAQAVIESVELAACGYNRKKVIVAEGVNGSLPKVLVDKELLIRALYEVTLNAVQATAKDGVVTVDAIAASGGPGTLGYVRITVADTGPGIPEEILPNLFDPFFSTREKARGLGLTTALAIMRQIGGIVEISETGPAGTVAAIQLPTGSD